MGEIVNLRRHRKQLRKAEAARQADQNRARHGRSKHERRLVEAQEKAATSFLDGHRRNPDKT